MNVIKIAVKIVRLIIRLVKKKTGTRTPSPPAATSSPCRCRSVSRLKQWQMKKQESVKNQYNLYDSIDDLIAPILAKGVTREGIALLVTTRCRDKQSIREDLLPLIEAFILYYDPTTPNHIVLASVETLKEIAKELNGMEH